MLKRFIPFAHAESIYKIDLDFYTKLGIKYVFVDLDNTLDSYKQKTPLEHAFKLKKGLESRGIEMIIVSNNRGKRVQKYSKELGVKPLGTWIAGELAGVEPSIMGIGPVAATQKVMKKAGYSIGDFDLIEANEAFAAQSVAVQHDLGFSKDVLNVNGGAIALGHPVGCSGNRILVSLLYEMQRRDVHKGLATLCVGGGMGCAAIVER